jgi:hypothetical protein
MQGTEQDLSSDHYFDAFVAILFGFFFLFFFIGLLFEKRRPEHTLSDYVFAWGLTLYFGCMSAASIGSWLRRRWAKRFLGMLVALGATGIFLIVVGGMLLRAFGREGGADAPPLWEPTLLVLSLFWALGGMLMFLGEWRRRKPPRPIAADAAMIALWPILLVLMAPFVGGVLFIPLIVFTGGGELAGRRYDHPYVGAATGFGVFIALFAILAYLVVRWEPKGKTNSD